MIQEVSIHKPTGITTYRVGEDLFIIEGDGRKTKCDYKPTKIKIGFMFWLFKSVRIEFSNGTELHFKGFPIVVDYK